MTALALLAVLLLVFMNAYFVIAEYALVRSRRSRLEEMAEQGRRGAALAVHQIDDISNYISAIQVGITMASIGIGASASRRWPSCSSPCSATCSATPPRSRSASPWPTC